ncbi:LysR substrate-binding domain-containing protein [Thalassospiraceae bacterium LMO-JJ14]|nr:LysR substrate-binding domain-containing protein [Thalassospiraceae bacterium LMO-JJ14]
MIFTQLRSFHAVAAEHGFTAASRVLNVGQPTLTSQVRALEEMFQVELFHRRGREIALTDAGKALFVITRRIMDLEGEARDVLNAFGGFHTGTLRVGAVGPFHATEMLSAFSERYPGIRLAVTVGNSREMVNKLLDYSADVAVLAHVEDDPHIFAMPYSRHKVVIFSNKSHRFARRRSIRIAELEGERMVLRERGSTTRLALEAALKDHGVSINPVMEIGSREAVWLAVARGIGIGVVSDIEFIPHPDLHVFGVSDADIYTTAHVNCLMERRNSRLIDAFFEIAKLTRRS